MIEFIKTYYVEIIAAVLLVGAVVLMFYKGYRKQAKAIVLSLVAAAEKKWGGGTGEIKYSEVSSALYEKLPAFAKLLLNESTVSKLIEGAVSKLKTFLTD